MSDLASTADKLRRDIAEMFNVDADNPPGASSGNFNAWFTNVEPMKWLMAGYHPDWCREIARGIALGWNKSEPPRALSYLTAVYRKRAQEASELPPAPEVQKINDRDRQSAAVRSWLLTGNWRGEGPEPGRPGCQIAPDIIAEARERYEQKFRTKRSVIA